LVEHFSGWKHVHVALISLSRTSLLFFFRQFFCRWIFSLMFSRHRR